MVPNKEQLQKEIDSLMRNRKIFFILAMAFFGVSAALAIASIVVGAKDIGSELFANLAYYSGIALMVAVTMLILRSVLFTFRINVRRAMIDGVISMDDQGQYVRTVDVKPVEETPKSLTREEELVKQYEDLYKQGFISEEDYKKKKEEILKK